MLLGTRQRNLKQDDNIFIELDNTRLERVLITKFLGVIVVILFGTHLSWA